MDFSRLSVDARQTLADAASIALRHGHGLVEVEHLLLAMLQQERGLAPAVLMLLEVPVAELSGRLQSFLEKIPPHAEGSAGIRFSPRLEALFEAAALEAAERHATAVRPAHLLIRMLEVGPEASRLLVHYGVVRKNLLQTIAAFFKSEAESAPLKRIQSAALERYGEDLTRLAQTARRVLDEVSE